MSTVANLPRRTFRALTPEQRKKREAGFTEASASGLHIQMELGLPDPYVPVYRFSALVKEHFPHAKPQDVPGLNLAGELLDHTVEDLRYGLALCRNAVEKDTLLEHKQVALPLNYMLYAFDWLNETDEGGICFPETAAQLNLTPQLIRQYVAAGYHLETRGPRDLLVLPPSFHVALGLIVNIPRRRPSAPAVIPPPALKADAPKFTAQPTLASVWGGIARKGIAARRKDAREAA